MRRLDGWESRLAAAVEAARSRPYSLGEHDCVRFACSAVEALTGADRWPEVPPYRTREEAMAVLARYGRTFEDAFSAFFGCAQVRPALARRGDVLSLMTEDGEKHLGVCLGARTACLEERGLRFIRTLDCTGAWRIG
jgi:hypothetical protein